MSGDTFHLVEAFGPTLQGEGLMIGTPCYFLRVGGCDYRCSWCDSLHAVLPSLVRLSPRVTWEEAVERIHDLPGKAEWVVLSGGNPLVWDLEDLVHGLQAKGFSVMVETQASIFRDWVNLCDFVVLSPKPPSSGMPHAHSDWADTLEQFVNSLELSVTAYQIKVVVFNDEDLTFAREIHSWYPDTKMTISCGTFAPTTPYTRSERGVQDEARDILARTATIAAKVLADPVLGNVPVHPQYHVLLWGHAKGV